MFSHSKSEKTFKNEYKSLDNSQVLESNDFPTLDSQAIR